MKLCAFVLPLLLIAGVDSKALKVQRNDGDPRMAMFGSMLKGMIATSQQAAAAKQAAVPAAPAASKPVPAAPVAPQPDEPVVPDSELVAKYMSVHDDAKEESDYEDDGEEEEEPADTTYSDHISRAILSATAATPEEVMEVKRVIKTKKAKKAPIHLATARLLPKELHTFQAQNLDGSVAAELAKVRTQLQEQNAAIAKAMVRQKAVAAKMANAVAEKLISQKKENARLTGKLAKEVRLEAHTEKKLAKKTAQWRGEKHTVIQKIQGLKMQVKQLSAAYQQSKAKTDHFKELQADASKQHQGLNEELNRIKKELALAEKRHKKERAMLLKMIQAKKNADVKIRELTDMAKNPTKRVIGVAHVEHVHVPVALTASVGTISAAPVQLAAAATGRSDLSRNNQQLAQELVVLRAKLSKIKKEQAQGKKMLWQIIGVKKKADARIKALRTMLKESQATQVVPAVPTAPAAPAAAAIPVVAARTVQAVPPSTAGALTASQFAAAVAAPIAALQHHSHAEVSSATVERRA